jgi:hypothetical protein
MAHMRKTRKRSEEKGRRELCNEFFIPERRYKAEGGARNRDRGDSKAVPSGLCASAAV